MSRVIVIVAFGLALGGCTSGGTGADWFKFEPPPVNVQLQSQPAGAEAKTSAGQACQTPCTLAVAPDKDFSVTFTLPGYEQQTVPVQLAKPEGDELAQASLQPNPVAVELAKSPAKRPPVRKRAATASATAKPAAAKPVAARPAAARPAAAAPAAAPRQQAPAPAATDPWPPVNPQ